MMTLKLSPITMFAIGAYVLLALFFAYLVYSVNPAAADLKSQPVVRVPEIVNPALESRMQELKKIDGLPLEIRPEDVGKKNPYF